MKAVGHVDFEKGTATILKDRLINTLLASACNSRYKKVILFIDEAYNLSEREFKWLMDIYNNLNLQDVRLYVFLFGSEELLARKQSLIMTHQHQIVGRFMVEECHFRGIQSAKELAACLFNYDTPIMINGKTITLTKHFFPEAFADNNYLISCAEAMMEQYIKVMKEIGIPITSEIPMMYFTNAVKYCFKHYGVDGEKVYFPTEVEWYESIINSGYVAAERIYYNGSSR